MKRYKSRGFLTFLLCVCLFAAAACGAGNGGGTADGSQKEQETQQPDAQETEQQAESAGQEAGREDADTDAAQTGAAEGTAAGTEAAEETAGEPAEAAEPETVTLVIPAAFENIGSQEEADRICKENGYESAELLEDGSLSVTMKKDVYDTMIAEFRDAVDKGLDELAGSEDFPEITAVEHSDDYSEFTVRTRSEEVDFMESYIAQELFMYGTLYHYYTGNDADHVHVAFVNEAGEVLLEQDSESFT